MKIKQLISILSELDPELDAEAWLRDRGKYYVPVLTFENAGRVIRVIDNILGKCYTNYNHDQSGKRLPHRAIVWKAIPEQQIKFLKLSQRLDSVIGSKSVNPTM